MMASFTTTTRNLFLLSDAKYGYFYLSSMGITKLNKKEKTKGIMVVVIKWRYNENGLLALFTT